MLSKEMQEKAKIYLTCLNSGEVGTGSVFDGVYFAKAPHNSEIHFENQSIYVHGLLAEDELLVSAGNQRYFFSLKDGWGIANHHLAAVSCGFLWISAVRLQKKKSAPSPPRLAANKAHTPQLPKKAEKNRCRKYLPF